MTHPSPRFCPQCGAGIAVGQNFCRSCGVPLRVPTEEEIGLPSMAPTTSGRLHLLVEVIGEAFRSGLRYLWPSPGDGRSSEHRLQQCWRWGLIAFWAGLAAQLGEVMGFILMFVGVALMAYARGFFGSSERSDVIPQTGFSRFDDPPKGTAHPPPDLSAAPPRPGGNPPTRFSDQDRLK